MQGLQGLGVSVDLKYKEKQIKVFAYTLRMYKEICPPINIKKNKQRNCIITF